MVFLTPRRIRAFPSRNRAFCDEGDQMTLNCHKAFSLTELLVVIALAAILMTLMIPAFTSVNSAGNVTKTAAGIVSILEQARAYAMANNTYVYVGIAEVDSTIDSSAKPQVATGPAPYGRIAIAVVASKDGTRGYDINNPGNGTAGSWVDNYAGGTNLVAINKLQRFENVHLADSLPGTGGMVRPAVPASYILGNPQAKSVTPFDWPLGQALGSGQYSFTKVINFDPQGVARIQFTDNADTIEKHMEIGIQQTHGTVVSTGPNVAAIHQHPITGATRTYRP